jgi:hypothetical protein
MIIMAMAIWEIVKELLQLVLVEKIRDSWE